LRLPFGITGRERESKELSDALRVAVRQERSVPVLAKIKSWLDTEQEIVLPRSPTAAAITYAQNQWRALTTYTTQGFLNIDNNASERALKRVAIGRKNGLFAGNDAAAENHARLWSLIATCERHGVDPQRYLTSVLAKIGQTPAADLEQFLPDVSKVEDEEDRSICDSPPLSDSGAYWQNNPSSQLSSQWSMSSIDSFMSWIQQLLSTWRSDCRIRRVVVLVLEGVEPGQVDRYLEQGLLHNLALLGDVGARSTWKEAGAATLEPLATPFREVGARVEMLPAASRDASNDLDACCAADTAQQEKLFAELSRGRSGVVVAEFDLLARLTQQFGAEPDDKEREILRDVYARMDEVVGKAYSFVDERTVLVVAMRGTSVADQRSGGLLFASCRLEELGPTGESLPAVVRKLLVSGSSGN
jgi:hypothetical protein